MTVRDALHGVLRERYGPVGLTDDAMGWDVWPCPVCATDTHNPLHVRSDGDAWCDVRACDATAGRVFDALGVPGDERGGGGAPNKENDHHHPPASQASARRRAEALIRQVDMAEALAKPPEPVRWRIDRFAQDGALTILAAKGGVGKSWIGMAACDAVTRGVALAGIPSAQGRAVYVDGEMGAAMMVERFRAADFTADAFDYLDATGLNLADEVHVETLEARLGGLGPQLVVIDSLRRFAPGARENDSDDIAPLVARLAAMARKLRAAVVLLHHGGHNEARFIRGSSAIIDQADAVFGVLLDRGGYLRLTANAEQGGKMRMAETPEDRWLRMDIGEGVVVVGASTPATTTPLAAGPSAKEQARDKIVSALQSAGCPLRKGAVAGAAGIDQQNGSFRDAWADLRDGGLIAEGEGGWTLAAPAVVADPPGAVATNVPADVQACIDKGHTVRPHPMTDRPTCVRCRGVNGKLIGEPAGEGEVAA